MWWSPLQDRDIQNSDDKPKGNDSDINESEDSDSSESEDSDSESDDSDGESEVDDIDANTDTEVDILKTNGSDNSCVNTSPRNYEPMVHIYYSLLVQGSIKQ